MLVSMATLGRERRSGKINVRKQFRLERFRFFSFLCSSKELDNERALMSELASLRRDELPVVSTKILAADKVLL